MVFDILNEVSKNFKSHTQLPAPIRPRLHPVDVMVLNDEVARVVGLVRGKHFELIGMLDVAGDLDELDRSGPGLTRTGSGGLVPAAQEEQAAANDDGKIAEYFFQ